MQKALGDLIKKGEEYSFFVPYYQRGYRWDETQIHALLNDLLEFYRKIKVDTPNYKYYSLQPLVVKKDENTYRVIDCIEKLQKETRITSWYINIYLLALLNELGKEITSDFIKIDDEIELSHLKINKNKVTIKNENIVYKKIKYPLFEKDDAIEMVKKVI
jgi:uncharacterized protein with ParB-like and HNH nuclease domain